MPLLRDARFVLVGLPRPLLPLLHEREELEHRRHVGAGAPRSIAHRRERREELAGSAGRTRRDRGHLAGSWNTRSSRRAFCRAWLGRAVHEVNLPAASHGEQLSIAVRIPIEDVPSGTPPAADGFRGELAHGPLLVHDPLGTPALTLRLPFPIHDPQDAPVGDKFGRGDVAFHRRISLVLRGRCGLGTRRGCQRRARLGGRVALVLLVFVFDRALSVVALESLCGLFRGEKSIEPPGLVGSLLGEPSRARAHRAKESRGPMLLQEHAQLLGQLALHLVPLLERRHGDAPFHGSFHGSQTNSRRARAPIAHRSDRVRGTFIPRQIGGRRACPRNADRTLFER